MELKTKRYTAKEFDEFILLPENVQRNFELIGGEIVEKMPTNGYCSDITVEIIIRIKQHLYQTGQATHVTAPDAGYMAAGERYIPDIGIISKVRQPQLPRRGGYIPNSPDLAVEVVSPTDEKHELSAKI